MACACQAGAVSQEDGSVCTVDDNGHRYWRLNGCLHRGGGRPAVVYATGTCEWFVHGMRHRCGDGPTIVYADGRRTWRHGTDATGHHRDGDRPAFVDSDGALQWRVHGMMHRDGDQPAAMFTNGVQEWWTSGMLVKTVCVTSFDADSHRLAFVRAVLGLATGVAECFVKAANTA